MTAKQNERAPCYCPNVNPEEVVDNVHICCNGINPVYVKKSGTGPKTKKKNKELISEKEEQK
jgi:hypothetical protein